MQRVFRVFAVDLLETLVLYARSVGTQLVGALSFAALLLTLLLLASPPRGFLGGYELLVMRVARIFSVVIVCDLSIFNAFVGLGIFSIVNNVRIFRFRISAEVDLFYLGAVGNVSVIRVIRNIRRARDLGIFSQLAADRDLRRRQISAYRYLVLAYALLLRLEKLFLQLPLTLFFLQPQLLGYALAFLLLAAFALLAFRLFAGELFGALSLKHFLYAALLGFFLALLTFALLLHFALDALAFKPRVFRFYTARSASARAFSSAMRRTSSSLKYCISMAIMLSNSWAIASAFSLIPPAPSVCTSSSV